MNKIGADELGQILRLVTDPADRKLASLVCKEWWVMEGPTRSSLRILNLDHLPRLLTRHPNLTTFETPRVISNADLALVAQSYPKLEVFILDCIQIEGIDDRKNFRALQKVGDEGLCAVANGCPKLSKIVIKRCFAGLLGIMSMITSAAHNLTHLDLYTCTLVTDQALEAIGSSSCLLRFLNLRFCTKITDVGLSFLANGSCSKTIEQLNLYSCFEITDDGVSLLCKMRVLEELDLSYIGQLTDVGGQAISTIRTLKKLKFQNVIQLTERTVVALAKNCINLEVLDLCGCTSIAITCIDAFSGHKCMRFLYLLDCSCNDLRGPAFERLALGCPSLESIVVEEFCRERLLQDMQESTVST
ncbi:PREDICTED: F-box/LRR-repeat protein 4-like [Fragaria vesca subsp. vesca]|uniref:F-box/LRR-repeat protein 4-like n=1 Tax=Fragaria vesca subsp. vesca TaxID=101020 RepID=UPI0002C35773|nr:PREDICTED: F-box/LRR-repeat protein 4-like [Fragaria vesca subsp. vesca]